MRFFKIRLQKLVSLFLTLVTCRSELEGFIWPEFQCFTEPESLKVSLSKDQKKIGPYLGLIWKKPR